MGLGDKKSFAYPYIKDEAGTKDSKFFTYPSEKEEVGTRERIPSHTLTQMT